VAEKKMRAPVPPAVGGVMQQKVFGLPVERAVIFTNYRKVYRKRVEKRQRRLIIKISFLKPFLEIDEKILLVTTGHSPPTVFEKLGIGWFFIYMKRALLVFTDRRIFHVPTTPIYKYRNTIFQIPYTACNSIRMKGHSLLIEYKAAGQIEKFFSLSGRESRKIRELVKEIACGAAESHIDKRANLCPQCAAILQTTDRNCRRCGLKFKSGAMAAAMAFLLPGGGYFYLRQPLMGLMAAVVELYLAVVIGYSAGDMLAGVHSNLLWPLGAAFLLLLEKAAAGLHARVISTERIPRKREITFRSSAVQAA
jgi:hypothetical protein